MCRAMSQSSPQPSSPDRGRSSRPKRELPGLFDVVRVRHPIPEYGINAGNEGTVVEICASPPDYLVDFSYEAGYDTHELPVYGLTAGQIEVVRHAPISGP